MKTKSDGSSGKVHVAILQNTEILPLKEDFIFPKVQQQLKNLGMTQIC